MSSDEAGPAAGDVTVVVLAGGTSRRFGSDKLAAPLLGSTVLGTVVSSLPQEWPVVVVGPPRDCGRTVTWTREDPPGGGPLAGVAAGVDGDMPYAGAALVGLVAALRTAPREVEGVVATDDDGVANPLLAAYRVAAVRRLLPSPAHGRPAKLLFDLAHVELAVPGPAAHDVDTPADLEGLHGPG